MDIHHLMIKNNWGDIMNKEEKVDFDLSVLTLDELIETYKSILNFLKYLEGSKIEIETKKDE